MSNTLSFDHGANFLLPKSCYLVVPEFHIICFVNCRFFSYSLDERIIPRHKILVANRVNFKLRYMLSGSDEEFNQRVQFAIEKRKRFESGYANFDASDDESTHVVPVASS